MSKTGMNQVRQAHRIAEQRRAWYLGLEDFEGALSAAVPALGVAAGAVELAMEKWWGQRIYIGGSRDKRGVLVQIALFVGCAAVQRGFPPLQALEMGRAAAAQLKELYKGGTIEFPARIVEPIRDAWINAAFNGENLESIKRQTGLSHRRIEQILTIARIRGAKPLRLVG